jgi:hypothetical protein
VGDGNYNFTYGKARNHVVMVALWSMRAHIAAHILREHVTSDVCGFCGLHNYTPVLQLARGKRGGQPTEVSCSNRYNNPTVLKLSARTELQRQGQANVHQLPCTMPHLQDGGVEARDGAALQHQALRH